MSYRYILAIDPSGAFDEGRGKTGWVVLDTQNDDKVIAIGYLDAGKYFCAQEYWNAHLWLINKNNKLYGKELIVVIEEYTLYADKAQSQSNSKMETCRLIGVLQHHCWVLKQPFSMQPANMVVNRWNDTVLVFKHIIREIRKRSYVLYDAPEVWLNEHMKDALRHGIHYSRFRNGRRTDEHLSKQPCD